MQTNEFFYKDERLPFVEVRYSKNSSKHYKEHLHETFSIGAIDRGEVLYKVRGKEATLKPGSLALIPPLYLHSCNPLNDKARSYYMLYIDKDYATMIQNSLFYNNAFLEPSVILLDNATLYKKYMELMQLFMQKSFLLEKEQKLILFLEKIFLQTLHDKKVIFTSKTLQSAKEILSNNLDRELSLEDLAQKLQCNPYTLLRNFKKEYGITPFAFRLNLRIELSKKLLFEGLDLSEIALKCGFFDQSHFQKYFKSIVLTTPKEYQNNFKEKINV